MQRFRQLFRNPSLFFRLDPPPPKLPGAANARTVKFKRPWIRNLLSTCLLYGAAFHIWGSLVLLQLDDRENDTDSQESTHPGIRVGDDEPEGLKKDTDQTGESYKEDAVFIPLTWPRVREGKFYAPTDPEWQRFVSVSKDNERLESLRGELAKITLDAISQSGQVQRLIGGPLSITGFWLMHSFPYKAPPTLERLGLEICDNEVSWTSRQISPEDGDRLLSSMRPLSVALAIRDVYMVFLKKQLSRLGNFGTTEEPSSEGPNPNTIPGGSASPPEQRNVDGLSQISQPNTTTQRPGLSGLQEHISQGKGDNQSLIISSIQNLPLFELGPGSDLHEISKVFRKRLKRYSKFIHTPRRGTFNIAGPVGIKGPWGFCRVEVQGEYDPASDVWSVINIHLREINLFQQKAIGDNKNR